MTLAAPSADRACGGRALPERVRLPLRQALAGDRALSPRSAPRPQHRTPSALVIACVLALAGAPARAADVVGFTLIHAGTDLPIGPLTNGQVLDLDALGTASLSVRADTAPAVTGSVRFGLDGISNFRTENSAPYALFGDTAGDYAAWSGAPMLGAHTLTATAFTGAGGSGAPGPPLTIAFEVVDPTPGGGGPGVFAWQTAASAPLPRYEAQGLAVGGLLYIFGGFFSNTPAAQATSAAHVYALGTNAWAPIASLPEPVTHAGQASDGDTVYLAGGFVGNHPGPSTAHVWVYDATSDSWSAGSDLPEPRGGGGLARVGRRLYFFGGGTRTAGDEAISDSGAHWSLDLGPSESPLDDAGAWVPCAPLPNPRNHLGGVALAGRVYAVGGQHGANETSGNQSDVHAYDPGADAWTPVADLPRPLGHIVASIAVVNGRLVVAGGVSNAGKVADVIGYDPGSDGWFALEPLPAARQSPVMAALGDELVVTGGYLTSIATTTWRATLPGTWAGLAALPVAMGEVAAGIIGDKLYLVGEGSSATLAYDLATDAWSAVGSLAQRPAAGNHHAAEVIDGKLYLVGGLGATSGGKIQVYDPVANTWQQRSPAPFAAGSAATAVIGGLLYMAGGIVGSATTNQVAVYNPVNDVWASRAAMPVGVNHAAAATDGTRLFVFGGRTGGNTVSNGFNYVQIYDPSTNAWQSSSQAGSPLAPLPQARGGMGKAVAFAGELYVMGGETLTGAGATAAGVYARVDVYDPVANTWRSAAPMQSARHGIFPLLRAGRMFLAGGGVQSGNSQSTVFEVYDADRCGPACPAEAVLGLSGAPEGGLLHVTVSGIALVIATQEAQSLEAIADAIAAAIHASPALAGLGIGAQAVGTTLTSDGVFEALASSDAGLVFTLDGEPFGELLEPPVPVPALGARGGVALALATLGAAALARQSGSRRRSGAGEVLARSADPARAAARE